MRLVQAEMVGSGGEGAGKTFPTCRSLHQLLICRLSPNVKAHTMQYCTTVMLIFTAVLVDISPGTRGLRTFTRVLGTASSKQTS